MQYHILSQIQYQDENRQRSTIAPGEYLPGIILNDQALLEKLLVQKKIKIIED